MTNLEKTIINTNIYLSLPLKEQVKEKFLKEKHYHCNDFYGIRISIYKSDLPVNVNDSILIRFNLRNFFKDWKDLKFDPYAYGYGYDDTWFPCQVSQRKTIVVANQIGFQRDKSYDLGIALIVEIVNKDLEAEICEVFNDSYEIVNKDLEAEICEVFNDSYGNQTGEKKINIQKINKAESKEITREPENLDDIPF